MFYLVLIINFLSPCWSQQVTLAPSNLGMFTKGESYYVNNDFFEAEKIFKKIINTSNYDDIFFKAMSRLVDIAEANGDKKLFGDILDKFRSVQDVSSESYNSLLYNVGKYSFHDGDCNLGLKFLNKVDVKTPYYSKALYIKASCASLNKKYSDALLYFDKLVKSQDPYATKDIKDLAMLGKARIFAVVGRFRESVIAYQSIDIISPYYLTSLYETGMLFISQKDYDNALYHLEALSLLEDGYSEDVTEFSLMKVKTMCGYIYMEQDRFEDASRMFDDVSLEYEQVKKMFSDELNKFLLSDDLSKIISHPYSDGSPRDLGTNIDYALFNNDQPYSKAFRDWLSVKEKKELKTFLNTFFSLNKRIDSLLETKPKGTLTEEELRLVAVRNLMNKYLKNYMMMLVKVINSRLDDIGLKAHVGKMDITWKIKENQSKKIKEIQEDKQKTIEDMNIKYKGYTK